MRYILGFLGLFGLAIDSFGQETKVNYIIQLNDKLVYSVANLHMYVETEKEIFNLTLNYYPGDLILSEKASNIFRSDSIKSATLVFELYPSHDEKIQGMLTIKANFSKYDLKRDYVILSVYDLRNKEYKRQLGHLTKENYICEYIFPNGGLLIRRK